MSRDCLTAEEEKLKHLLEKDLLELYGPVLHGSNLRQSLGYETKNAFRLAVVRKVVPVPIFNIEHRRGKFALTKDVAAYLAKKRCESIR